MSRPWRLRHKLILGLALVVGSVALLLGGALFGLLSYEQTMRTTRGKLEEMQMVSVLRDHVHAIEASGQGDRREGEGSTLDRERQGIRDATRLGLEALVQYRLTLESGSVAHHLDPDGGEDELAQIARLEQTFHRLDRAVERATSAEASPDPGRRLLDDPEIRSAYADLDHTSRDLFHFLVSDVKESFEWSKSNHRRSLLITGAATILAVVLVFTLLYYFRVWVFAPIRELQAGVLRVKGGEFDHPIHLASQDELEELANEFNAMTTKLRDVYRDLARQVEERSRQLVAAEKMVSVGFLAAGVAHEINNPMASIAFCAEALERRLQHLLDAVPGEAEVIVKYLKMIEQEAFRCKQITEQLLNYSRSHDGRREPVSLTGPIQNVLDLLRHHPASKDRQVMFQPTTEVVAAVDAHEFQGVVNNLVVNALENMEPGGTVTVNLRTAGEFAEVTVRDTGVGMPPDVLRNIFEPFFTKSRTGHGTGLGLFICHRVVTEHGGTITATSPGPGRGSTFTVRLPLRSACEVPAEREGHVLPFPSRQTAAA